MSTSVMSVLLWQAVNDAAVYSALVPWILDTHQQAPSLSRYVQQKQALQDQQLQAPHALPQDMRQCVVQAVGRCCSQAFCLEANSCLGGTAAGISNACNRADKQGSAVDSLNAAAGTCSLSQPAARLAKLHGHMLAHGLMPDLPEQLHVLIALITSGPLQPSGASTSSNSRNTTSNASKHKKTKQDAVSSHTSLPVPNAAAMPGVTSPEELLGCRACAARYAAKALECCGRLLCCMPEDVVQGLAACPHVQQYAPGLAAMLLKTSTTAKTAATLTRNAGVIGSANQTTGLGPQQQQTPCTPAATIGGPGPRTTAASGGLANAGGAWSASFGRPSAGGSAAQLSGLGMLVHNTPGSAGGRSTGGQGSAGRANNVAITNREKSRDLFFSILRRCSSRLEALRQQQTAAADLQGAQQQAAAAAVFNTELQELVAEVGIAAKQLLLQLAPSNQVYLAELFTACVLQAASTGEPILEPQLALMAERDPSKFQKLQQRLADRTGGVGVASAGLAAGQAAVGGAPGGRPRSAGAAKRQGAPPEARSNSTGKPVGQRVTPQSVPLGQHQQVVGQGGTPSQQQQSQQCNGASGGPGHKARSKPAAQGLAATGLMYKMPPGSSNSTGGGKPPTTAPRQVRPTPSSAGGSTGNSFRLTAAAGLNTPVPFAGAAGTTAGPSPGASPLLQSTGASVLAPLAAGTASTGSEVTPVLQQGSSSKGRSMLNPSVSRVVQLNTSTADAASAADGLFAGRAATGAAHNTPASAPAAATNIAGDSPLLGAGVVPGSAPLKAPGPGSASHQTAATAAQKIGSMRVIQQMLADMPAGQHVLLLVLHAADSSSFNRSLLTVMLARSEQLLSSSPDSLAAAAGLGQQATAVVALASYCGYLSFVAGASQNTNSTSRCKHTNLQQGVPDTSTSKPQQLLQQQPVVDVASLLARVAESSNQDSISTDAGWRVALAVPFICSYLQFLQFNTSAAGSQCVTSVVQQLRSLQALPCMGLAHPGYGSLPACISSYLQSCQLLQQDIGVGHAGEAASETAHAQAKQTQQQQQAHDSSGSIDLPAISRGFGSEWWCRVLQQGSQFVDNAYWSVCCPGLQKLNSLLSTVSNTALQTQQPQQQKVTPQSAGKRSGTTVTSRPANAGTSSPPSTQLTPALGPVAVAQEQRASGLNSKAISVGPAAEWGNTSPAGSTSSLRHTTPLMLAPREPPVIDNPPADITAALAEVADPLKQQLQQAFLGQYSTDDNPVKMRDVLSLVNGILCANSLSLGLSQGVPPILQQHLDSMSQEVQDQLGPVGAAGRVPLQGQDLARAVHSTCNKRSAPAIHAALESAMQKAAEHAHQAATAACTALLPADVPPAAAGAAAALVAASCKASCAQRLLQEVPVLVQSSLADQADELVKLVTRQWAVHTRITAPAAVAPDATTSISGSKHARPAAGPSKALSKPKMASTAAEGSVASSKVTLTARRIKPVFVADAGAATQQLDTAWQESSTALEVVTEEGALSNCKPVPAARRISPVLVADAGTASEGLETCDKAGPEAAGTADASTTSQALDSSSRGGSTAAGAAADGSVSSSKAAPVARRITALPIATLSAAGGDVSGVVSNSSSAADSRQQPNMRSALARPVSQQQIAAGESHCSADAAALAAAVDSCQQVQPASDTVTAKAAAAVEQLLKSYSRLQLDRGMEAERQTLADMQQQIAAAVAQQSFNVALSSYLHAAMKMLPRLCQQDRLLSTFRNSPDSKQQLQLQIQPVTSSQHCQRDQQLSSEASDPWSGVIQAATCAAELLVNSVTAGMCTLSDVEQQLVQALGFEQDTKLDKLVINPAATISSRADQKQQECTCGDAVGSEVCANLQNILLQLLAGAVVHAFLTNAQQKSLVWGGAYDSDGSGRVGHEVLEHFAALPALVMKSARTDKPAWLLRQLRLWIQQTTLGC